MFKLFSRISKKFLREVMLRSSFLKILLLVGELAIVIMLLLLKHELSKPILFEETVPVTKIPEIQMIGEQRCIDATDRALALLKTQSPTHDAFVHRYVGVIECVEAGSGMHAEEKPPRYAVGKATWQAGDVWYAGTIVHDACHSQQYNDYLAAHPGTDVPRDVHFGKTAEEACLAIQIEALKNLHATTDTIEYLKNVINTDYWDAKERNW